MRAEEVLRMQAELRTQLLSHNTHQYTGIILSEDYEWEIDDRLRDRIGKLWCEAERDVLAKADSYLIAAEMMDTVWENAITVPLRDVQCTEFTPPSQNGFMVFEKGLQIVNEENHTSVYVAVSWHVLEKDEFAQGLNRLNRDGMSIELSSDGRVHSGILLQFYRSFRDLNRDFFLASLWDEYDGREREVLRMIGDPHLAKSLALPIGISVEEFLRGAGKGWENVNDEDIRAYYWRQLLVWSVWDLMSQTVYVERHPQQMTEKRKEMWHRKHLPACVSVVLLRRQYSKPTGQPGTGAQLQHRIKVRAHPHKYRVGPGRQEVITKWIEQYEKGPDGAPLLERPKVTKLAR